MNEIPKISVKEPISEINEDESPSTKNANEIWFTKFFKQDIVFYLHLFVYSSVIGLCLMLNLMRFNGRLWTATVALGWLVGLATHYTIYRLSQAGMFTEKEGLKASFYIHLTVYLTVTILMIWGNLAVFQGFLWVPIAVAGWGIGLGVHGIVAFENEILNL